MKQLFWTMIALAMVIAVSDASARSDIYYSGKLTISEITVVKDDQTVSYDIPVALSSHARFSSEGSSLNFGKYSSKCPPYLGDTTTELRIPISDMKAVRFQAVPSSYNHVEIPMTVPATGFVVVPEGARVFGTCGGDGKTLTELGIQVKDQQPKIRVETN